MTVLSGQLCTRGLKRWDTDTPCILSVATQLLNRNTAPSANLHATVVMEKPCDSNVCHFHILAWSTGSLVGFAPLGMQTEKLTFWKERLFAHRNDVLLTIHAAISGTIHICERKIKSAAWAPTAPQEMSGRGTISAIRSLFSGSETGSRLAQHSNTFDLK